MKFDIRYTKKPCTAKKEGTISGLYDPTQPSVLNHKNCGIISTCAGSISVESMSANSIFLPLKLPREKLYATSDEDATAPIVPSAAITNEFLKNLPKLTPDTPRQPTAKFSNVHRSGIKEVAV